MTQPPFSVWTSRSVEGGSGRHRESAARLAVEQGRVQNSTGVVQGHILIGPNRADRPEPPPLMVPSLFLLEFIQRGLRLNARSIALTEFPGAGVS